jgi:hypothetical protein
VICSAKNFFTFTLKEADLMKFRIIHKNYNDFKSLFSWLRRVDVSNAADVSEINCVSIFMVEFTSTLRMEAANTSEKSVTFATSKWYNHTRN